MPDIGRTAASARSRTFGGGHPSRHDLAAEPSDTNRLNRAGFDELPQRRFRDAHVPPEADETNTPLSDQAARETLSRGKKFGRLGDSQQPLSTLATHAARLAWPRSRVSSWERHLASATALRHRVRSSRTARRAVRRTALADATATRCRIAPYLYQGGAAERHRWRARHRALRSGRPPGTGAPPARHGSQDQAAHRRNLHELRRAVFLAPDCPAREHRV